MRVLRSPAAVQRWATHQRESGHTIGLVPMTLAPVALGLLGPLYGVAALVLDGWFVWHVVNVLRERTEAAARRLFQVSLVYLFALFLAMILDRI